MILKNLLIGAALCLATTAANAAVIFTTEADMPGGVPILQAERASWATGLGPLTTEGFEGSFITSNNIDFGSFFVSITGATMNSFSGPNPSTRTEGNQSLGFNNSAVLTFTFVDNISAFGIDWSSLEGDRSTVNYSDSEGNSVLDIFPSVNSVTAGFFGISDVNLSSLSFNVTSIETLEFDFIQFETANVPAPAGIALLAIGLVLMTYKKKRV